MPSAASIPQSTSARQACTGIDVALSFAGAGVAGMLWWADRTRQDVPCSADGGCGIVAASPWSHVNLFVWQHVPVALLGLVGYLFLLTLSMLRLGWDGDLVQRRLHGLVWLVTAGGTAYSWYLQWIAHYAIGAYCPWCRTSAFIMTALFATATAEWWIMHRRAGGRRLANE